MLYSYIISKDAIKDYFPETSSLEEYEEGGDISLSEDRFKELQEREQFLLTASNGGFGKRTSAYEYRISGRGGMGVTNMSLTKKNGSKRF